MDSAAGLLEGVEYAVDLLEGAEYAVGLLEGVDSAVGLLEGGGDEAELRKPVGEQKRRASGTAYVNVPRPRAARCRASRVTPGAILGPGSFQRRRQFGVVDVELNGFGIPGSLAITGV